MFQRSMFVAAGLILSASAFAMPKVGDKAVLDLAVSKGGQALSSGQLVNEVTSFDAAAKTYGVRTTVKLQGQADQVEENATAEADMTTDAQVDELLANCSANGGVAESVTVPAGTFASCAITGQDQSGNTQKTWVAKVSFGVAKVEITRADGIVITGSLVSFQ